VIAMLEREIEEERRLRRARITAVTGRVPEPGPETAPEEAGPAAEGEDDDAARHRVEQQTLWVDLQVRRAMERGEFDNLPGAGKPLQLGDTHDPDWWVKRLVERERISVLPPALALRKEDAELDAMLDRESSEEGVRRAVRDFNRRVVEARRQLTGGPPVITPTRDEDDQVAVWRERRARRREEQRRLLEESGRAERAATGRTRRRPRWWPGR
jgi:hypothetical protein